MQTFSTHTPRPLRPPGRSTLSLLPLLLLLLLPAMAFTQVNCFSGFNAGDNQTWCAEQEAFLDGGYDFYDDPATPDSGTPTLTWIMPDGDEGDFYIDGVNVGNTASGVNFNNSENSITGFPIVSFIPDAGVTEIRLRLLGNTDSPDCLGGTEVEDVTLYFDPIQNTPLDASVAPAGDPLVQVLDDGDETTTNAISVPYGGNLMMAIDENNVIDNGQQFDDIRKYVVTYSGTGGVLGLPTAGVYTQSEFDVAFNDLTLTSMVCDPATVTLNINAFYDRNPANFPAASGDCAGPVTSVDITLVPRAEPTATIGAVDNILIVCKDDEDVEVVVTGTPFTQVTYTVSYDGGATVPAGTQTLELDATGTSFDIMLDANDGTSGQDIVITLIEQEFLSGPPCPVTISKPLTIQVLPLPEMTLTLTNPEDAVVCSVANGGPDFVNITVSTNLGEGTYQFTADAFANGNFFGSTGVITRTADANGVLMTDLSFPAVAFPTGEVTIVISGPSITRIDLNPDCTNDSPDASITFMVQAESYVVAEVNDSEGGTITLSDYSGSGAGDETDAIVTFCDGETFTLDVIDPTTNNAFADIVGSEALLQVSIGDNDGLISGGGASFGIYNFTDNTFSVNEVLDIPNSQTTPSTFNIFLTPFMDNDGNGLYSDGGSTDDCLGNTISVTVNVLPAPTVTVEVSDDEVCEGETVTVTVTASEPGTASLILDQGGDPILVDVDTDNGDGTYSGTYMSDPLDGLIMFTVTTFIGDDADCSATVNQMVMTDVEPLPEASVAADVSVCHDEDAMITFTGTEGNGTGFTFNYSISSNGDTPVSASVSTDGTDATVDVTFEPGDLPAGETIISLISVANNGGLMCVNDAEGSVSIMIEDEPIVSCGADDDLICSGDDYSFTLTAGSDEESVIGNTLYYSVTTTVTTTVSTGSGSTQVPVESTEIVIGDAGGVTISGSTENMSGFNQTIEISVTPFYFDDEVDDPTEIGDACTGETVTCSVTVKTMPMVTFGGNDAVCEGGSGTLVFTGPPNGRALVVISDSGGSTDLGFIFFTAGGSLFVPYENIDLTTTVTLIGVSDGPVFNPNTCIAGGDFEFTINVTPSPEADFDEDGTTVCEGDNPVISLTGTPFAQVTIDSDNDANDQVVSLDENGEGSFTVTGTGDETFTITQIAITTEDGNGQDFTCTGESDDSFVLTVNPAPVGALMTNAILCAGEAPQVQFNITNGVAGPFTIFVNGVEFNDVENGDVLDFIGTAFETLEETTTFTLQSIVEEGEGLVCSDLFGGNEPTVDVIVNPIPEATAGETPDAICSGDDLQLSVTGTPAQGAEDNDLMFEVTANNAIGDLAAGESIILDAAAAADLNTALGLSGPFINGSTTDNESVSLTVVPFFEGGAGTGGGGDCEPTEGFVGDFAEGNFDVATTPGSNATAVFDATSLLLTSAQPGGFPENFNSDVSVSYTFTQEGNLAFDYAFDLETFGSQDLIYDVILIDFDGNVVLQVGCNECNTEPETGSGSFDEMVMPGMTLVFAIDGDDFDFQEESSIITITDFSFAPECSRCEGDAVNIDFDILPALFADFSSAPERVCEGDNAEICIAGTPDATVTVFIGDGVFVDVKLDGEGNGCFTTVGGLTEDTDFIIMGLTTLDDMPQCSYTFTPEERPVAPVMVIPTPSATIDLEPSTVCAGDEAIAEVSGTPNATVYYSYNGDPMAFVLLDGDGEGEINLSTTNTGTSNIVCHVVLIKIEVTIDDVTCENDLDDLVTLIVRPLPTGTITAGAPACAGGTVPVTFNATTNPLDTYTLIIEGPGLDEGGEEFTDVTDGSVVFMADEAGEFTMTSITDGTDSDPDISCSNEVEESTTVIIEEVPNLTAAITGTVGTANLDSDDPVFNTFRALACDEATINLVFGSSTEDAQAMGELMINVEVNANDDDQVNVGPVATTVITFDQLNSGDFLDGILSNIDDLDISSIEVVLTPFFENGADAGALEAEDCPGGTLSFFIDITPAVMLEIDAAASTLIVCEGDAVSIVLTGTPGAEVSFSSTGIDLDEDFEDGMVDLHPIEGTAIITGTAGEAGTATLTVDMVMKTFIKGNISRQCMLMDADDVEILINEVPEAELSIVPEGPICNGETVTVYATLVDTDYEAGDSFTFIVDGVSYTATVDVDGTAELFTTGSLTASSIFKLTSITNDATGCTLSDVDGISSATILVEEIPTGEVIVTIDGEETTVSDGVPAEFQICANERVDMEARNTNAGMSFFEGSLDASDSNFGTGGCLSSSYDYDAYNFTIDVAGMYVFTMEADPDGEFLDPILIIFEGGFDPSVCDFIAANDDANGTLNSQITIMLNMVPGDYTLVGTTFSSGDEGDYIMGYGSTDGGNVIGLPSTSGNPGGPIVGEDYVSVDYSISEDIDFYGLGQSGTIALPIEDFEAQFSREYNMISGAPVTITLAVTYYNETGEETGLNDGECVGITDNITITINPNPKTEDVDRMVCSGEDLTVDLDDAITNGVVGATFSYTVSSDAHEAQDDLEDRPTASSDDVLANFTNTGNEPYTVVYTVTPFGIDGDEDCQGNDFTLTVTVKPEPVITAEQEFTVCSGDDLIGLVSTNNDIDSDEGNETSFEVISFVISLEGFDFVNNSGLGMGSTGGDDLLEDLNFTNTSSGPQTVTIVLRPTADNDCIGDDETIIVTVLPEAVVADFMIKVCSGGSIDLGFDELTANGVGDILSFVRTAGPAVTLLRIFDETGADVTGEAWFGGSSSNPGITSINDSYLNTGTGTLSVFYAVSVAVQGDGEEVCELKEFILEVKVVEEVDVELTLAGENSNICAGEPITLQANYDGSGTEVEYEYSYTSADGVVLDLEPSLSGAEVVVSAVSGSGVATVMVMVSDDNSCIAMNTRPVGVGESPAELTIEGPADPCTGITNFYDVTNTPGSTYEWSLSDPAAGTFVPDNTTSSVDIQFNSSAGYGPFTLSVTETSTGGCSTTSSMEVILTNSTFADFSFDVVDAVARTVSFMEETGGGIVGLEWSYNDGTGDVVFSNDPNPTFTFPGTVDEIDVTLSVAGSCSDSPTGIDVATKTVSLNPDFVDDMIELKRGTNFISFDVQMSDRSPGSVFQDVLGLTSVSTFENGIAKLYDPSRPPFANSLREIKDDYGYVVVVDQDQTFTVSGLPVSPTFQRDMDAGINYVGHCAPVSVPSATRLADMEANGDLIIARTFGRNVTPNVQVYIPGRPSFAQSLKHFHNSVGYAVITNTSVGGAARVAATETESYDFVFGTVQGVDNLNGDEVEVLNAAGEVVGTLFTNADGTFSATPLYGKVERPDGMIDGAFEMNETVSFRYGDQVVDSDLTFNGEFSGQWIDLDFSSAIPGLTASVYPNPAGEQATVSITTAENMTVEVVAMDVNGRVVSKLLSNQELTAGTTRLEWEGIGALPAGIYNIVITHEGRILSEATQRVVKR